MSADLSPFEAKTLASLAEQVAEDDGAASNARGRQEAAWRLLLGEGRSKTAIAEASGLTVGAMNFRLTRLPNGKVARGAGAARAGRAS